MTHQWILGLPRAAIRVLAATAASTILLTMVALTGAQAKTTMRLAWAGSEDAPYAVAAHRFKELIEAQSNGEIVR